MHGLYSLQTQAGVRIHELPRSACILRFKLLLCPEKRVHFCCLLTASRAKACRCQGPHCLGRASEAQEGHGRWREKAMTLSRSRGRSDTQGHVGARAGRSGLEVSFGGLVEGVLRGLRGRRTRSMAREGDDTLQVEGTKRHPGTRWSESRTFRSRGVLRGSSGVSFAGVLRGCGRVALQAERIRRSNAKAPRPLSAGLRRN